MESDFVSDEPPVQHGPELPSAYELLQILSKSQEEVRELNKKLEISRFGLERYSTDKEKLKFYVGFEQYEFLVYFFQWLLPTARQMKYPYSNKVSNFRLCSQPALPLMDEFFYFCVVFTLVYLSKI